MSISTAIALDRVSRVIGYKQKKANFGTNTSNLPHRIALLGEGNTANQASFDTSAFSFISAQEVGDRYGYGSPLHLMARILRPLTGNILGGVETVIYPQMEPAGASATAIKVGVAVATTVTANVTHKVIISGRDNLDGTSYKYSLAIGDDAAAVRQKIIDAISGVYSSPVAAVENVADIDVTTKWAGTTSAGLQIRFDTEAGAAGVVYSEVSKTTGAGDPDIAASLALFGEEWNTDVINPYGATAFAALEAFNGIADPDAPTGRYLANVYKPFVAYFGSLLSDKDDVVAITDAAARKVQMTNVLAPAPNSEGFAFEAAVNLCATTAARFVSSPHLGNGGKAYPDMPIPADNNVGDFSDYDARDYMAKRGASTVLLKNDAYTVQDMFTTYHPDGETPPKFRKVRDLNILWNGGFQWLIIMDRDIQDKAIVKDDEPVTVGDTISPKQVLQLIGSHVDDMVSKALYVDAAFTKANRSVEIEGSNPARLNIFFRAKITSTADIVSSDVEFDFNYSS